MKLNKVMKIFLVLMCACSAAGGFLILNTAEEYDILGYSSQQIRILNCLNILYLLVLPVGILISILLYNRWLCVLMIMVQQICWITYFGFIGVDGGSGNMEPCKMIFNIVCIISVLLWMKNKINNKVMVGILLISNINILIPILRLVKSFKLLSAMLLMLYLLIFILPLFIVDKKE